MNACGWDKSSIHEARVNEWKGERKKSHYFTITMSNVQNTSSIFSLFRVSLFSLVCIQAAVQQINLCMYNLQPKRTQAQLYKYTCSLCVFVHRTLSKYYQTLQIFAKQRSWSSQQVSLGTEGCKKFGYVWTHKCFRKRKVDGKKRGCFGRRFKRNRHIWSRAKACTRSDDLEPMGAGDEMKQPITATLNVFHSVNYIFIVGLMLQLLINHFNFS